MNVWNRLKVFLVETGAQAQVEYVLVVVYFILFFGLIQQGFEVSYGKYVEGLYFVLGLPVP